MLSIYFHLNILKLLFFVYFIPNTESTDGAFEACTTPNNTDGHCINIHECPSLLNLLHNVPILTESLHYLRKANCGYEKLDPKVCCSLPLIPEEPKTWVRIDEITLKELPTAYLLPSLATCGIKKNFRITNGFNTELGEYPWMTLLEYDTPSGNDFHCGGALINKRYILTAAHCVFQEALPSGWTLVSVRLGEYDTTTNPDCLFFNNNNIQQCAPESIDVGISEKIVHYNYRKADKNHYDDIALLRLDSDITSTDYVKPICLPTIQRHLDKNYEDQILTVAGWGKTETGFPSSNVKLQLELPAMSNANCSSVYNTQGVTVGRSQICAGGILGKDSCNGDSGGPLMVTEQVDDFNWYAVGIVSFGPLECGQMGIPGVYTKVSDYMLWIINNLKP